MDTVALVILLLAVAVVLALVLIRLRERPDAGGIGRARPPKVHRRRVAASDDPMAPVVASHSQAVEPDDAAVEELRLRAQANRVAAAEHQRQADALGATEAEELQAQAHHEAAAEHQRAADEFDQRRRPA